MPDVKPLSEMLARAFDDDPVTRFLLASERRRAAYAQRFFAWELRRLIPQEQVHVAADGQAAALWALPKRWRETPAEVLRLGAAVFPAIALRLHRVLPALSAVERKHPKGAHMYLAVLGTDPSAQGQGIGSAAIASGLGLADSEGLPAYLESSKERNIDFYARFGFKVVEELQLPGGGPKVWRMWREPVSAR
jgi:GNAT superfamily N-acetyltransferase